VRLVRLKRPGYNSVCPGSITTPDDGHKGVVYESPTNGRGGVVRCSNTTSAARRECSRWQNGKEDKARFEPTNVTPLPICDTDPVHLDHCVTAPDFKWRKF
jgi:hypothetical protein